MINDLKFDKSKRSIIFEHLAKLFIRNDNKNNFIFLIRNFSNLEELLIKYRLNLIKLNEKNKKLIKEHFSSIDLIEFKLKDINSRIVEEIIIYEVKTKIFNNKSKYDICLSSYETYHKAQHLEIKTKLISFVLFENWKYSYNIHDLDLSKYNIYSRTLKNRHDATIKAELISQY